MKEFFNFRRDIVKGLEVFSQEIADLGWIAMQLLVKGGSRFDPSGKEGLTHLLEHMVSESGTRDFPEREALERFGEEKELRIMWGETFLDGVRFSVRGKEKHFQEMLYFLFQLVFYPCLNNKLEREKIIVRQEINQIPSNVRLLQQKVKRLAFGHHPCGRSSLGTPTTLARITWQDIKQQWCNFYNPNNCCLVVIGSLPLRFLELIEETLPLETRQGITPLPVQMLSDFQPPEKNIQIINQRSLFTRTLINQDRIDGRIVLPREALKPGVGYIITSVLDKLIFREFRSKRPWAYSAGSNYAKLKDIEVVSIFAGVELGKGQETLDIILEIMDELKRHKDLFKRHKKEDILGLELYDSGCLEVLDDAVEDIMYEGRIITLGEMIADRNNLSGDDFLQTIGRFFKPERISVMLLVE